MSSLKVIVSSKSERFLSACLRGLTLKRMCIRKNIYDWAMLFGKVN